jgi:hypothetical protein
VNERAECGGGVGGSHADHSTQLGCCTHKHRMGNVMGGAATGRREEDWCTHMIPSATPTAGSLFSPNTWATIRSGSAALNHVSRAEILASCCSRYSTVNDSRWTNRFTSRSPFATSALRPAITACFNCFRAWNCFLAGSGLVMGRPPGPPVAGACGVVLFPFISISTFCDHRASWPLEVHRSYTPTSLSLSNMVPLVILLAATAAPSPPMRKPPMGFSRCAVRTVVCVVCEWYVRGP